MKNLEELKVYMEKLRRESNKVATATGDNKIEAMVCAVTASAELVAGAIENLTETLKEGIAVREVDG